ncbi:TauD/TfdA dioxygenase family protein [Sabulicella glaciei]|uniref:TauD/TfdA family dioxygenase n=1 Tax=Sabulicella glaciei TaxID=2984948 RepID=A0ABT3P177_9PROT|nr:TauD/TfdA family dioxygenase [Roseococcus sp. MDT2-1-1]MCW8087938.1 TauD/TfdA family dioxygenase [Roseococcus sp. MDT2-1-1]
MENRPEIRPLSPALGAEILGVDLREDMPDALVAELRDTWLRHGVVFFRDQNLPPRELVRVARRFGEVVEYPFVKGLEEAPEVIPVMKLEHEKVNFGGVWHTDTAYLDRPPMATMLVAREIPPVGGDTMFASGVAAYEALSEGMRKLIDPLRAVNSSAKADVSKTREDRRKDSGRDDAKQVYEALHPVVRTHPETGRKALYVNAGHTSRFEGMTEEESAPLLEFLFRWQVKPEWTCRFRWREGSVAFWDNRQVLHYPLNDYHGHRRVLHRVTLEGDVPA